MAIGTVLVPAGIYEPDFTTDNGIYYRASTHLIVKALGITQLSRGGIFVPNPPTAQDKADIEAKKTIPPAPTQGHAASLQPPVEKDFRMGVCPIAYSGWRAAVRPDFRYPTAFAPPFRPLYGGFWQYSRRFFGCNKLPCGHYV